LYVTATKVTWTKEQTYMLITEYRINKNELENPTNTKSVVWDKVSDKINGKFNSNFNGDMCANKWRSLKNTYKRVRFSQRS
jgi:archaellin